MRFLAKAWAVLICFSLLGAARGAELAPDAAVERQTLQVNGYRFDALAAGPKEGELVLLLHGFPQFANACLPLVRSLAEAGYRAVAVDQRGYSPGARPAEVAAYGLEQLKSDVLGFAQALGAQRFHLVGHDWGGVVAWQVAADEPGRLKTVTILSTPHTTAFLQALKNDPDQRQRARYIGFFRLPDGKAEQALLANQAKALRGVYPDKIAAAADVDENLRRLTEPGAMTAALNWYRALDLDAQVGPSRAPTLFVWGAADHALGETAALATAARVQAPYRFVRLEGRGHWLLDEAPDDILPMLLQHLKGEAVAAR